MHNLYWWSLYKKKNKNKNGHLVSLIRPDLSEAGSRDYPASLTALLLLLLFFCCFFFTVVRLNKLK